MSKRDTIGQRAIIRFMKHINEDLGFDYVYLLFCKTLKLDTNTKLNAIDGEEFHLIMRLISKINKIEGVIPLKGCLDA